MGDLQRFSHRAPSAILCALIGLAACGGSSADTTGSTSSSSASSSTGQGGATSSSTTTTTSSSSTGVGGQGGQGGQGGAPGCTALLCDDFESGAIDPAKWTVDVGYDPAIAVTVQSTQVAHGKNAALAHLIDTGGGFAMLRETSTFPALADDLWGRAYFYTTVSSSASHTGFVSAYVQDQRVLEVGQYNGQWQLTYYDPNKEYPAGYPDAIPQNKWVCLEWHFSRTGPKLIEVFVDGAATVSYDANGHQPGQLTAAAIGIDNHGANPAPNDAYWDDVAIDAKRVGCLP
jgi:hypothetical protein